MAASISPPFCALRSTGPACFSAPLRSDSVGGRQSISILESRPRSLKRGVPHSARLSPLARGASGIVNDVALRLTQHSIHAKPRAGERYGSEGAWFRAGSPVRPLVASQAPRPAVTSPPSIQKRARRRSARAVTSRLRRFVSHGLHVARLASELPPGPRRPAALRFLGCGASRAPCMLGVVRPSSRRRSQVAPCG